MFLDRATSQRIFYLLEMMRPLQPELLIGGQQALCCFHHLHQNHVNIGTSSSDELHADVNSSMRRRKRAPYPRPEAGPQPSHCNGPSK